MTITLEQARKLLTSDLSFTQLGFSMMLTRLKALYAKDSSQSTLQNCTSEINEFLGKFKVIMSVDYAAISKL